MNIQSFETALRQLLNKFGVEIGVCEETSLVFDPVEPLQRVPPACWIGAAALHMESLYSQCTQMVRDLGKLNDALSRSDLTKEEVDEILWDAVNDFLLSDLRFHASYFPLYAELIRDILINSGDIYSGGLMENLRPGTDQNPVSVFSHKQLLEVLARFNTPSAEDLEKEVSDLLQLEKAARETTAALEMFSGADTEQLAFWFAGAHVAVLHLAEALIHTDVSMPRLLASLKDE